MTTLRRFVDIPGGQVHLREAGAGKGRPLVLIHASPGSALMLAPLVAAMGVTRHAIAPDTLGNGDSSAPMPEVPEIDFFAEAHLAALDALGIGRFDLYGTHTGASIAAEIAIRHPSRVRRLVLDGVGVYPPELQAELLARYAPEMVPDQQGSQVWWAWHFVRDTFMYWPWYRTDAAHRRTIGLPPAGALHEKLVEVLKAIGTYHKPYRAAFRYDKASRFPLIRVPTLAACAETDMLRPMHDAFAAMVPRAAKALTPGIATPEAAERTAAILAAFLDQGGD